MFVIIRKLKNIYKKIKYILFLDKYTKNYINFNFQHFSKVKNEDIKGEVLIDFFDWKPFVFFWSILSNYLSKKKNLEIKFFYFPLYENFSEKYFIFKKPLIKIYESFGAKLSLTSLGNKLKKTEETNLNQIYKSFKCKSDLIGYKYKGILIGDLIYDSVIRSYQIPTVELNDERLRLKFLEAHLYFKLISDYLDKNNVKFLVPSDCVYNQYGIITRICDKRKIKVLILYNLGRGMSDFKLTKYNSLIKSSRNPFHEYKKIFNSLFPSILEKNKALKLGEKLLNNRVKGTNKEGIQYLNNNPYLKSKNLKQKLFSRETFQVVLVLHNFFDAPHKYREFYYCDYLEWAIDTINILKEHKINTYIKFHPINIGKSADDVAFKVIRNHIGKSDNFITLEKETSYADLIENNLKSAITCHGTVANELPYFGITVINCGDNPHINYKFCIHPFSKLDYRNYIKNIKNIKLEINLSELHEFYFMNYYYFNQNEFNNKIDNSYLVIEKKNCTNEDNIKFNESTKYYDYIISKNKNENIIKKINDYIKEYFTNI